MALSSHTYASTTAGTIALPGNFFELSHNKELIFATQLGNSISNLPNRGSIETAERTVKFIEQGHHF